MANIKLIFQGSEKSNTDDHELNCFYNANNEIYLSIDNKVFPETHICLDKLTAVKLVKHLKLQISYIESEVSNG